MIRYKLIFVLAAGLLTGGCTSPLYDQSFSTNDKVERGVILQRLKELQPGRAERSKNIASTSNADAEANADGTLLFEGQKRLEVNLLVAAVLRRNPDVTAMVQAWHAVQARYPQATSLDDPKLSLSVAPETLGNDSIDDGYKIGLSQNLPWPGKLDRHGDIVEQEAQAAKNDVQTVRQRLILQVRRMYYDDYYIYRAIEINKSNLSLLKALQGVASTKYAAGAASMQDALQAKVKRYQLEHRTIILTRMQKVTRARINALLHRSPQSDLPSPPTKLIINKSRLPELRRVQRLAVNDRSELQALANRLQAQQAARRIADLQYFPNFSVMGTYSSLWNAQEKRFSVGVGLNLPVQIDRRHGAELEALAKYQRLAAQLTAQVDQVLFEVTKAYDRLIEVQDTIHLYENSLLPAAQANLEAARSGYEAGDNDFSTLIDAEENQTNVRLEYQRALRNYYQHRAELEHAVGRELIQPNEVSAPSKQNTHHEAQQ